MKPRLSVIVPALNEQAHIAATLAALAPARARGAQVIVVDGGSHDDTVAIAGCHADLTLRAPRGRASQMNAGAVAALGDVLWFVHADCVPPDNADVLVLRALAQGIRCWGRFDVCLRGETVLLRVVERAMNWRSRASGIATGDQALFMTRAAFDAVGAYPPIALMEDIAISRALKRLGPPRCLRQQVLASARRWEARGIVRTVLLMWRLRLAYFFGAKPERLAALYESSRR